MEMKKKWTLGFEHIIYALIVMLIIGVMML